MSATQAMAAAAEYAAQVARGDVTGAGETRRTIESLLGQWVDGQYMLPRAVAERMGRPELGPRYELRAPDGDTSLAARTLLSTHYTSESAEAARLAGPRGIASGLPCAVIIDLLEVQS